MDAFSYNGRDFLFHGNKYTILSGAIHYFRILPKQWRDRLLKLKACGFNCVETYVCHNLHERKEGEFDFEGRLDIKKYIQIAEEIGLNIILRPSSYICAEWDFGGLPSWLLNYEGIRLRCNDNLFLTKIKPYYEKLFEIIKPHLCTNGGNIIMMQIENEYGSYGNDREYLRSLEKIYRDNGIDCLLFTSDGPTRYMLNGGTLEGCLPFVNFGNSPEESLALLADFSPNTPLMCCEFWDGWFDRWGVAHHTRSAKDTADVFERILASGSSVNMYMFCGGTNFGFCNGANLVGNEYQPTVTSYDYDAPISESGELTQKYYEIKSIVEKHFGNIPRVEIPKTKCLSYGKVQLTERAKLLDCLSMLSLPVKSVAPLTFEALGQDFGYVLYSVNITGTGEKQTLRINGLRDRAVVMLNENTVGTLYRNDSNPTLDFTIKSGSTATLYILTENMGRVNYGPNIGDKKGITEGILLNEQNQFNCTCYSLPMNDISKIKYSSEIDNTYNNSSCFLRGYFYADEQCDSFLSLDGFTKGIAFINGFNLGRYWNVGPQKTLYVPAPLIKNGINEIVIFESDVSNSTSVELIDKHNYYNY